MSTIIADIIQQLDTATQTYVFNGYAALVTSISHPLYLALVAYVAFLGWSTSQKWAPMSLGAATKHALKLGCVVVFATNWDLFSTYFYNLVTNGPNEIANVLVGATGGSTTSSNEALQSSFDKGLEMGQMLWNKGGMSSWPYYIASVVVFAFDFAVTGIALLALATAKGGIAVTVVLAPIFAFGLLFESGRGLFNGWLQSVLGFAFVPLIVSSVILFVNPVLQLGIDAITAEGAVKSITCLSGFILGSIIAYGLLKKADGIAGQMAGGFSIAVSETMGHAASAASGLAAGGMAGFALSKMLGKGSMAGGRAAFRGGRWAANKLRGTKSANTKTEGNNE